MTRDAAHIADIERRLANLAKAPRCGARTRAGHACKQAAVSGRARCRMHGGAKGSGGPRGHRNGNFKHGLWTMEERKMRQAVRVQIRETRALIHHIKRILHCDRSAQVGPSSVAHDLPHAAAPALWTCARPAQVAARQSSARHRRVGGTVQPVRPDAWGRVSIFEHTPP
jgi:hypothetical protein